MQEMATHGGLECGVFKGLRPDLDIITYGPVADGEHTPDESLDLASFAEEQGVDDLLVVNYPFMINNLDYIKWINRMVGLDME